MNILYGCCYKGHINDYGNNIDYVDILPDLIKTNGNYICSDIRSINFNKYDIVICSPPCNYYSRANYRRNISEYALNTKDLLPYCINECLKINKPFIIENVRNRNIMKNIIMRFPYFIYYIGRHTYFTNQLLNLEIEQIDEYKNKINMQHIPRNKRQGGINVENVFNLFLENVLERYYYERRNNS